MLLRISLIPIFIFALINIILTGHVSGQKLPILTYHHIMSEDAATSQAGNAYVITDAEFKAQMRYLHDNGYRTITISQLEDFICRSKALPQKSVLITFDDGYASNRVYAYPVLKQYGMHAVIFLITGYIKDTEQPFDPKGFALLSWSQVDAMKDVFEFGSHTDRLHYTEHNKAALTLVPKDQAEADIALSLSKVQDKDIFCFPFGAYNGGIVKILRRDGVKIAFGTTEGYATMYGGAYSLPRFTITPGVSIADFAGIVSGARKAPRGAATVGQVLWRYISIL